MALTHVQAVAFMYQMARNRHPSTRMLAGHAVSATARRYVYSAGTLTAKRVTFKLDGARVGFKALCARAAQWVDPRLPGVPVHQRELCKRTGSEGPKHDPYAYERRIVILNGWSFSLHTGLDCWFSINGTRVAGYGLPLYAEDAERECVRLWEVATGMTIGQFDKAYDKVHPYFDDPMGNPGDYI